MTLLAGVLVFQELNLQDTILYTIDVGVLGFSTASY